LRSGARARRQGRPRERDERIARYRETRPQMERRCGAQTPGDLVRGAGAGRSADAGRAAQIVVHPVLVKGVVSAASLSFDRRTAPDLAGVSADRRAASAARTIAAQHLRTALSRDGRYRAGGTAPDWNDPADGA